MDFGKRLKHERTAKNITLEELGQKIGVSRQTIQRYESGVISNIPSDKIESIAKALDTTPAYLMGWGKSPDDISDIYDRLEPPRKEIVLTFAKEQLKQQSNTKIKTNEDPVLYPIKVVEKLAAGLGYQYNEENESNILYTDKKLPDYDFASLVEGDSMKPKYNDGEVVLIKLGYDNVHGGIYAVDYDGKSYLKKVYFESDRIRLVSLNKKYKDIYIDFPLEGVYLNIIGRVVGNFTPVKT